MAYFSNRTHSNGAPTAPPPPAPVPAPAARRVSSKLALSLTPSAPADDPADPHAPVHPLRHSWVFSFRAHRAPGNKIDYEEGIKRIAAFASIESFWALWAHLQPPSALQPTTDYLLFHAGVRRPVWEDPLNQAGGKWILRLRKGVADRLWEDLVLAAIGDQFAEDGPPDADEHGEICGCTISVRPGEDIISIWHRTSADQRCKTRVLETIRRVLNLPETTSMDYKTNNDSLNDKAASATPLSTVLPLSGVQERA